MKEELIRNRDHGDSNSVEYLSGSQDSYGDSGNRFVNGRKVVSSTNSTTLFTSTLLRNPILISFSVVQKFLNELNQGTRVYL